MMAATGMIRGAGCEKGGQKGRFSGEGAGARELRLTWDDDAEDTEYEEQVPDAVSVQVKLPQAAWERCSMSASKRAVVPDECRLLIASPTAEQSRQTLPCCCCRCFKIFNKTITQVFSPMPQTNARSTGPPRGTATTCVEPLIFIASSRARAPIPACSVSSTVLHTHCPQTKTAPPSGARAMPGDNDRLPQMRVDCSCSSNSCKRHMCVLRTGGAWGMSKTSEGSKKGLHIKDRKSCSKAWCQRPESVSADGQIDAPSASQASAADSNGRRT